MLVSLKTSHPCRDFLVPPPPAPPVYAIYASETQQRWSPNLEAALYNRMVRLLIHCNNQVAYEEGYLLFYVGDAEFAQSCSEFPELCAAYGVDSSSGIALGFGETAVIALLWRVLVAVGVLSVPVRRWIV